MTHLDRRHLVAALVATLVPIVVAGQTTSAERYVPPRTSDGQPDLQGIWLSNSATPLERPSALADRPLLTDEEVGEFRRRYEAVLRSHESDFITTDRAYEVLLSGAAVWKNPNATGSALDQVELQIDNRTSLIVDPPDGRVPALTAEARARQSSADAAAATPRRPTDIARSVRCMSWGVPRLGGLYGAGLYGYHRIFQAPGLVVLYLEAGHEARIVPLDGRPHLGENLRQWSGDSRGRWEGNTLVVETTNFAPSSYFRAAGENLHVVERFTRVAPDRIDYEITLTDPTTWERPWTALVTLRRSDQELYEFACHEGNYEVMRSILRGTAAAPEE
jgi:hypothetical protein